MQEIRSFRQIRASPFSVFMFDFRLKRKGAWTFKHDFRLWCKEESMWCKSEKLKELINFVFVKFEAYLLCVELTFLNFAAGI